MGELKMFSKLPQLRIAVNSRCGRACFFCRPSGEAVQTSPALELDPKTVLIIAKICVDFGINKIKLTGGDPALWPYLSKVVQQIKNQMNCSLEVISRHPRIVNHFQSFIESNLDLLNFSVDTLDPELHQKITGIKDLEILLDALKKCVDAGIPCKVNMVIMSGINDHEVDEMINFCQNIGVKELKLLDLMADVEDGPETFISRARLLGIDSLRKIYLPLNTIADRLRMSANKAETYLQPGGLGNPMLKFTMPLGLTVILKDHHEGAWYGSICAGCKYYPCDSALMALRLTADSRLQYCLFREDLCIDTRQINLDKLKVIIHDALQIYDKAIFHQGPK